VLVGAVGVRRVAGVARKSKEDVQLAAVRSNDVQGVPRAEWLVKTIRSPRGDHAGSEAFSSRGTTIRSPPPATART
jgi:hypothetical protein